MNQRLLSLGAGLGVSLGIALLMAMVLLVLQRRRTGKLKRANEELIAELQGQRDWMRNQHPQLFEMSETAQTVRPELPS